MSAVATRREQFEVELTVAESYVAEPVVHEDDVLDPRVVRGAELLDEKQPGWADRVDLENFFLSDPLRCVLGYVYKNGDYNPQMSDPYSHGLQALGISAAYHGFCAQASGEWDTLSADWRLAIQARKTR